MKRPPGWAPSAERAASIVRPFADTGWVAPILLPVWLPVFWSSLLAASVALARMPSGTSAPAVFLRAAPLLFGVGLAASAVVLFGYGGSFASRVAAALVCLNGGWLLWLAAICTSLHAISRPGSALRNHVRAFAGAWLGTGAALTLLSAILPDLLWSMSASLAPRWMENVLSIGGFAILMQSALLPNHLVQILERFWSAGDAQDSLDSLEEVLVERLGGAVERDAWGLRWRLGGASLRLELARAPGTLLVSIAHPGLPPRLSVVPRSHRAEGLSLADPLLNSALSVQGLSPEAAAALLAGSHEVILPLFHAWEQVQVSSQRLLLSISGPPFPGTAPGSVPMACFVAERVEECQALVALLVARAQAVPRAAAAVQALKERR